MSFKIFRTFILNQKRFYLHSYKPHNLTYYDDNSNFLPKKSINGNTNKYIVDYNNKLTVVTIAGSGKIQPENGKLRIDRKNITYIIPRKFEDPHTMVKIIQSLYSTHHENFRVSIKKNLADMKPLKAYKIYDTFAHLIDSLKEKDIGAYLVHRMLKEHKSVQLLDEETFRVYSENEQKMKDIIEENEASIENEVKRKYYEQPRTELTSTLNEQYSDTGNFKSDFSKDNIMNTLEYLNYFPNVSDRIFAFYYKFTGYVKLPEYFRKKKMGEFLRLEDRDEALRKTFDEFPAYAIDSETTVDVDDAVAIDPKSTADGGYRFFVHISDVSSYIDYDSLPFYLSLSRMTSLYFGQTEEHIFPREWVREMSLAEGKKNRTLTVEICLNASGEVTSHHISLGLVSNLKVRSKSHVEGRLEALRGKPAAPGSEEADFQRMYRVAALLLKQRNKRGALSFCIGDQTFVRVAAIIENFMLLAGHVSSITLQQTGQPATFNVLAKDTSQDVDVTPHPSFLAMTALNNLKSHIKLIPEPMPHNYTGLSSYSQVTSPIRRSNDLLVHYMLRENMKKPGAESLQMFDAELMRFVCIYMSLAVRERKFIDLGYKRISLLRKLKEEILRKKGNVERFFIIKMIKNHVFLHSNLSESVIATKSTSLRLARLKIKQGDVFAAKVSNIYGERVDLDSIKKSNYSFESCKPFVLNKNHIREIIKEELSIDVLETRFEKTGKDIESMLAK